MAIELCKQSDPIAARGCMEAFANTDFREDLKKIDLPTSSCTVTPTESFP